MSSMVGTMLYCGGSTGCGKVLDDPWSHLGRVPISVIGLAMYLALLVTGLGYSIRGKRAIASLKAGYVISCLGAGISLLLTGHSILTIRSLCFWCLASAATTFLIVLCHALIAGWCGNVDRSRYLIPVTISLSLVCLASLGVVYQSLVLQLPTFDAVALAKVDAQVLINAPASPQYGNPAASETLVFFGDLECESCRELLPQVLRYMDQQNSKHLVFRHLPLAIHDLSYRAAVLAQVAQGRGKFWEFTLMITGEDHLDSAVLGKVEHLIFGTNLPNAAETELAVSVVKQDSELAKSLGLKKTPTVFLVRGDKVVRVLSRRDITRLLGSGLDNDQPHRY